MLHNRITELPGHDRFQQPSCGVSTELPIAVSTIAPVNKVEFDDKRGAATNAFAAYLSIASENIPIRRSPAPNKA
jgi:hypothetical protein